MILFALFTHVHCRKVYNVYVYTQYSLLYTIVSILVVDIIMIIVSIITVTLVFACFCYVHSDSNYRLTYSDNPICSMVLVYLPTKLGNFQGNCW